jgi:hypothetical protein
LENDKIKQTACSEKAGISQPEIFLSAVRNIQNTEKYNL